jgi:alpha-tubulin suppressor-like RCC1 family protein
MADHYVTCWGSGDAAEGYIPTPIAGISTAIKVESGDNFACALLRDSTVACWGANDFAQLGDGTHKDRPILPAPVRLGPPAFSGVSDIAVGSSFVCALKADDHTVWCWGSNGAGQLGNYTVPLSGVPHIDFAQPIQVVFHDDMSGNPPLQNVVSITAGSSHACAMFANGEVDCWGLNNYRQLGNNEATDDAVNSPIPVRVPLGTGWTEYAGYDVHGGGHHTCIRDPIGDGSFRVACWGDNESGQVGGRTGSETKTPIDVVWITGNDVIKAQNVVTGGDFSCTFALLNDGIDHGGIACWGANNYGQIGDMTVAKSPWPLNVFNAWGDIGGKVPDLAAGWEHACALIPDRTVWCWGSNVYAQLGTGSTDTNKNYVPVKANVDAPLFTDTFGDD